MIEYKLYNFIPLSVNDYYNNNPGRGRGRYLSPVGKQYKDLLKTKLLEIDDAFGREKWIYDYCKVEIIIYLDSRRFSKLDADNVIKPIQDCLYEYMNKNDNKVLKVSSEKIESDYNSIHIIITPKKKVKKNLE